MRLCNETVTVFNKRLDPETGAYVYLPTVITGASWYCEIASAVDTTGLHAADRFIVRIPADADFGGKEYMEAVDYKNSEEVEGLFTLAQGDVIVKAAVEESLPLAQLHERYSECCTILGVTDNRRAPNAPHFKVVGK